jgi:3-methyladenine DNA glycosylase/8-oxoguanine DNA glycosylase
MRIEIAAKPPFSLFAVIHSHGWARLAPFNLDQESGEFSYLFRLKNGRVVKLWIEELPGGVAVEIDHALNQADQYEISAGVTWMLALDQDFTEFYELARDEPKLQHVEKDAYGRLLRSPTLFEDTIKTILTTNTAWGGTIRMTETLVSQFGDPIPGDDSHRAFPTPEKIAASNEDSLRSETRLGYRSPYILNLAQEIVSGNLDIETLKTANLPPEEVRRQLLSIKGVGNYAAANLLMLMGIYSYLTIDSWALKMVSHEWFNDQPISQTEVEYAFEKWGQWKGLAYWLWDWSYGQE